MSVTPPAATPITGLANAIASLFNVLRELVVLGSFRQG
jgi:hypothetical protein